MINQTVEITDCIEIKLKKCWRRTYSNDQISFGYGRFAWCVDIGEFMVSVSMCFWRFARAPKGFNMTKVSEDAKSMFK